MQNISSNSFNSKGKLYYSLSLYYFYQVDVFDNFFICSYLRHHLSVFLPYYNIFIAILSVYLVLLIKYVNSQKTHYSTLLSDYLIIVYLFNLYKFNWVVKNSFYLLLLAFKKFKLYFLIQLNLPILLYKFFSSNTTYKWFTLCKKYSYFGYFRINQNNSITYFEDNFIRIKS